MLRKSFDSSDRFMSTQHFRLMLLATQGTAIQIDEGRGKNHENICGSVQDTQYQGKLLADER